MKNAVERYGADATRCALLLGAEGMDDPDWRAENVSDVQSKFEALLAVSAGGIIASAKSDEDTALGTVVAEQDFNSASQRSRRAGRVEDSDGVAGGAV